MIVITAPTGDIGNKVLRTLLARVPAAGEAVRVIVRDPTKLPDAVRDRVEVVSGSHGDTEVVNQAFAGADAVFWLVPPASQAPSLDVAYSGFSRAAAAAIVDHGVGHVVGISALGRGTSVAQRAGLVSASLRMDDQLAATGAAYRALTNASFMDNVLRQVDSIRAQGVFYDTVEPDRRAPLVATRDIAATAADLLLDRSWTGVGEVPLIGPENVSANDMARIMSEVLERPIRYRRQPLDALAEQLTAAGLGSAFVEGMVDMMRAKDDGLDDGVTRTRGLCSPTSFRQWCTEVLKPVVTAAA